LSFNVFIDSWMPRNLTIHQIITRLRIATRLNPMMTTL